ncbi:DUF748 domain-containing protein [Herbaspirillum lusitanum]|uniref:DUF748 domain-containing protein n=1 Tax=Herbaspirillum lusitanum TaxID=213312 RepID=A0ABW9AD02_9BURK
MATSTTSSPTRKWQWQRYQRPLRWIAYIVAALLLLAAISWLALPGQIKKIAIVQTQEKIGRKLELGEVAFNPFKLALTVSDITLYEPDQKTPFFSAKGLLVNASAASIFRLAPVLDEVKLTTPDLHVVRLSADGIGRYNFSDVIDRVLAMPKSEGESHFTLANVQLENGNIKFEDKVSGKSIDIKTLQIGVPFISNQPGNIDSFVQPHLSADINGTHFALNGRSKPFTSSLESAFAIDINRLDLVSYLPFLPLELPVVLESAKLSTKLDLSFSRAQDAPKVALSGDITLDELSVTEKNRAPLLKSKRIAARIKQLDVFTANGEIEQLEIDAPQVWAAMNNKGELNWLRVAASASGSSGKTKPAANKGKPESSVATAATGSSTPSKTASSATPAATPGTPDAPSKPATETGKAASAIVLKQVTLRNGEINWRDEANAAPAQSVQLSKLSIDASDISTAADAKPASVKIAATENGHGSIGFDGQLQAMKAGVNGKASLNAVELSGYQNYLNRSLAANLSGKVSGSTELSLENQQFKLAQLGIEVSNLKLAPKAKGANAINVKSIALQNAAVDLSAHKAQADSFRISGLQGEVRRESNGEFSLTKLLAESPETSAAGKEKDAETADKHAATPSGKVQKDARATTASSAWQARLSSFSITDSGLNFEDANVGTQQKLQVRGINLQVQNLSSQLDQSARISLQAQLNKDGKLSVTGQTAPQLKSINLDLDGQNLPVGPFQAYFTNVLNVTLSTGLLNAKGKLAIAPPLNKQPFALSYTGNAALNNFRIQDKLSASDFLRWRTLNLNGIQVRVDTRTHIALEKIVLSNFYARVILSEKGRLNLQDILVSDAQSAGSITDPDNKENAAAGKDGPPEKPSATSRKTTTSSEAVTAEAPNPNAPVIRVGQILLDTGNVNYTDNFVKPNYTANMTGLSGSVGKIASDEAQPAPLDLKGKIDNDAPLQISGTLNPLFKPMFLDIKASANGVQLPRLTPYSAKYAGYPITKGKLSMDVQYKIENDKLVAQNDVRIEQLTFGDHVDSPSATKLPVMLAVSLLKDRNGNINLNLPISGSLSDPQFSIGSVILRIFTNLIVKAVTSPFALISSMFNSSAGELSYIEFEPGSSEITADIRKKLDTLGYALNERPGIKLDIMGRADPKVDDIGLRQEALNRKMRALKRKDLIETEGQPSGKVELNAGERSKYMEKVYKDEKFKKPRNVIGISKSLPEDEMEKLIVDNTEVTQDDLRNLAQRRADQIRNYLQEQSVIPAARIFLVAPRLNADDIKDKGKTSRVDLTIQQ